MPKDTWIKRDERTLCLDGYPLRVVRPGPNGAPFGLEQDGRWTGYYHTLASAKVDAIKRAREIDEFEARTE